MRRALLLLGCLTGCFGGGVVTEICGAPEQPCCAGAVCNGGARCTASGCVACGALSQVCCADGSCQGRATCDAQETCVSCGQRGQPCCAQGACDEGSRCEAGVCASLVSCATTCTLGAQRCAGAGLEACQAVGTCPEWRTLVAACPAGASCQAPAPGLAECVEPCPGACTAGTLVCAVDGLRRCVASGTCPSLAVEVDATDRPQCVPGAAVGTEVLWESPTPFRAPLVGVVADSATSYWLLDALGNVFHRAGDTWSYELRAQAGRRVRAVVSCGAPSRLFAVGENGWVYRRQTGTWTEENVGAQVTLLAAACELGYGFYAAGEGGRLYFRAATDTSWSSVPLGTTRVIRGLGALRGDAALYAVGEAGTAVRCELAGTPAVTPQGCVAEAASTTADLFALWVDRSSLTAWAVGAGGTLVWRNATQWAPWIVDGDGGWPSLRSISGAPNTSRPPSLLVAGDDGFYAYVDELRRDDVRVGAERLTGVALVDSNNVLLTSASGLLWHGNQLAPRPGQGFVVHGGARPTSSTLRAVASLGGGRLLVVGDDGRRLQRSGGAWVPDEAGLATTAALHAVAVRSAGEAYAAGAGGQVLVRRYGVWSVERQEPDAGTLRGAAVVGQALHVVGDDGRWLVKDLAGGGWRVLDAGVRARLEAVAAPRDGGAGDVVAVGADCTVLALAPGAEPRREVVAACPAGVSLAAARVLGSGELVLGGSQSTVLRRGAQGFVIEPLPTTTPVTVRAFAERGGSTYALADDGALFRRVGTAWVRAAAELTVEPLLAGVDEPGEGLFVVGGAGLIWRLP